MNPCESNSTLAVGKAQQVSRTGGFDLPCSADIAFPLFTPEGERGWVKDWDPHPIFPDTIVFQRDTVFRQGDGDEEAIWTILDADRQAHRAEYVRVAHASHTAHIIVTVEPLGAETTRVVVSYTITTIGGNAATVLDAFSETAYAAKMCDWRGQISRYLQNQN